MKNQFQNSFMDTHKSTTHQSEEIPVDGFYSNYIYNDLMKIRSLRTETKFNHEHRESIGCATQCSPQFIKESTAYRKSGKSSKELTQINNTIDTNELMCQSDKQESLIRDKDEHIKTLKELLFKTIDVLGITKRENQTTNPILRDVNENELKKRMPTNINICPNIKTNYNRKEIDFKKMKNSLERFLNESNDIKKQLYTIDEMIESL